MNFTNLFYPELSTSVDMAGEEKPRTVENLVRGGILRV